MTGTTPGLAFLSSLNRKEGRRFDLEFMFGCTLFAGLGLAAGGVLVALFAGWCAWIVLGALPGVLAGLVVGVLFHASVLGRLRLRRIRKAIRRSPFDVRELREAALATPQAVAATPTDPGIIGIILVALDVPTDEAREIALGLDLPALSCSPPRRCEHDWESTGGISYDEKPDGTTDTYTGRACRRCNARQVLCNGRVIHSEGL